ncbi:MFS transporter [Parageobacillus toebii NBRC 107807]|uniref:MFS family arabinose efflux permease n=1 Tax=Parageobacillus toebii NBRC 107807 TaxID=1223503 RepID=A0A6G9J5B8_9BACL|nr:MFS transporter [Parageobacillus toebii]MBB3867142.1 putative MFS family arabinose efflux permease [Parageobacillus toebii NBRC 107807]QIQ33918.1 MFS transporter [Parageobacillus toebii NBRC 107807]
MNKYSSVKNHFIFLVASFLFWLSIFIYMPILSPYVELLGGTYTFIGIVLSSYGLMQFLFRVPIGVVSDFIKRRKPFIILGMLMAMISSLMFALTDSLGWALVSRSFAGIAAATWVAFTVLYSSYFRDEEVHQAMSRISFVVVLAQLIGMSFSGYIVDEWGWRAPFWIGGVLGVIGMILSLFIYEPREIVKQTSIQIKDLLLVMREPLLLKVSLLSILAHSIIFTTMFGFIPVYALQIGLQERDLSMIVFSFMIPHALATLFMGKVLVPILGKWKSLTLAFFCSAVFTLITPIIKEKELLCIVQALNGFSLGLLFPLLLGMSIESIADDKRATAMGTYQAIYAIGMFVGPYLAGMLNSAMGIHAGFYFAGVLGIVATTLILLWNYKERLSVHYSVYKLRKRLKTFRN